MQTVVVYVQKDMNTQILFTLIKIVLLLERPLSYCGYLIL